MFKFLALPGMSGRFRRAIRHVPAMAGVLTLAGTMLAGNVSAQAATAGHGSGHHVSRSAAAGAVAHGRQAGAISPANTPDARAVCKAMKVGHSTCMSLLRTNTRHYKGIHPDTAPTGYGPAQLQSAYNLPSASAGNGQTVAVVDAYDDPNAEVDLQVYRAQYGLPVCDSANGCFQKLNQDGQASPLPPAAGSPSAPGSAGWDGEESLDLDMISAICPNCHIILVEANSSANTDLDIAEDAAVATGARYVSNSWGSCEYSGESTDDAYFNHPGVVITAAGGDYGYDNSGVGCSAPSFPAASPYVTSVGGTYLAQDSGSPRGWDETAWDGTTSGCSVYETKPAWQTDSGCTHRTTDDVSAVADPNSGVAVYDTYSEGGWGVYGGTSVATPIIAATYALAGSPVGGTYPAAYLYAHPAGLNDITAGSDGSCTPAYLCTAGPGYDGPTGLGTPDGVTAFQGPASGVLSGSVTSKAGAPLAGATVSAGSGATATTDSSGDYSMTVPDGTYSVAAEDFGYKPRSTPGMTISTGQTTTQNFTLTSVPSHTLTGTVADGSGHKWPLYAAISVSGYPGGAVYTNPYTGQYSITLPDNRTYTLTVKPVYPGYNPATASVRMLAASKTRNFNVTVDATTCTAAGYTTKYQGTTETFTGWSGTTTRDGWTNMDNEGNGEIWNFSNPGDRTPPPGGDSDFAIVDSFYYGHGNQQDTSLVSPVENLSKATAPVINFDTYYWGDFSQHGNVDLSLDGGQTWTTVWSQSFATVTGPVSIPIPQAADQPDVRVRFHFTMTGGLGGDYWAVDNVFIGNKKCAPVPGGIVAGVVTDNNTGKPVNGVTVSNAAGQTGVSAANPADANLPDGFYWMFASPGSSQFTTSDGGYTPSTQPVDVAGDTVTHQDWSLQAGNLSLSASSLSVTQTLGATKTKKLTFTDTGTQPVHVDLTPQRTGFTPMGARPSDHAAVHGAPLERIKGHFGTAARPPRPAAGATAGGTARGARPRPASPSDSPWTEIANYPEPITDNAVGYDPQTGDVYSAGGLVNQDAQNTADAYVYDASAQAWNPIAPLPQALNAPSGAFLNGTFYTVGGWDSSNNATTAVYAYNPSSNAWSQEASLPAAVSAAAVSVLGGKLYVVGGCTTANCAPASDAVYSYNPGSNTWTQLADYPTTVSWEACAGIDEELACAGGTDADTDTTLSSTYIYSPSTNTWSQGASMPYDDTEMAYSGSGNQLQIVGGVTADNSVITNQAAEYDPSSNTWSTLPNATTAEYRGGGSCGLYQVGGLNASFAELPYAEVLPGYDQCVGGSIPWLSISSSAFTLSLGQSQTVAVTMDSSTVSQPGAYTAQLGVETSTPYQFAPINIAMQANPPSTWSKVTGTVTDAGTGNPIAGATVQICTQYSTKTGTCGAVSYTLTTGSSGNYQLWLNRGYNPLQIIAAANNYQPISKVTRLVEGVPDTVNFALNKTGALSGHE